MTETTKTRYYLVDADGDPRGLTDGWATEAEALAWVAGPSRHFLAHQLPLTVRTETTTYTDRVLIPKVRVTVDLDDLEVLLRQHKSGDLWVADDGSRRALRQKFHIAISYAQKNQDA